ncbi:hypothetical protein DPMN_145186 [Dreissena polymorpha]|uniref:Uncharacterized protein n=1 Tax=Dreissena polymorpha TaxID=45954 RepID=A0A9D4F4L8_DREPO|nr:hypothetical protein DPMN_145186 [Dreissena polymorpha]
MDTVSTYPPRGHCGVWIRCPPSHPEVTGGVWIRCPPSHPEVTGGVWIRCPPSHPVVAVVYGNGVRLAIPRWLWCMDTVSA